MKKILLGLALSAAAALGFMSSAADAAPITYNMTLTATNPGSNVAGGTGSFSLDGNDYTGVSNEFFTPTNPAKTLLSISFLIDGHTFDLADAIGGFAQIFFQNGAFAGVTYTGIDGGDVQISLNAGALSYTYSNSHNGHFSQGTVSASLVTAGQQSSSVPEPATLAVLGMSLLGLGAAIRRRRSV